MRRANSDDDLPEVPLPPWRKARKPSQPRPQLSRELIVETGLRVLDAEGLDALSMRRVAQELGTGPASLYAHVSAKEELLELIYDRVLGEVRLPEYDPSRWLTLLRQCALELHRVIVGHADVARAALASIPTGPNAIRLSEYMFGLLIDAGMPPRDASLAFDRIVLYVCADAFEGSLHYPRMKALGHTKLNEYFHMYVAQIEEYFSSLPSDRFPHLSRHARALVADGGEARFRYGLDLLFDGLVARMPGGGGKPAT
ncbi:TetR/AcrR family transcriptional regulator C-terminal domain-containing protein [Nonomuraea rhodomycinica]|uniref:TetR/AcrR family transcriptional regulator C-terminal domain-containing protein n=1 Tax=Nonomuraea rhodomycinica TaxID=1712872 RepID=A0A7Y6MDN4_9ACTN|nr:TetR/AcrR family transcriptional regulator C-terminal domain-containing protein [Nonomuraea rhodomycinica]NUW44087.1 TetR/AcrR family transcriptional regulator C-terminal domain-containing protein [Nonomuraea rhodomycinica]